MNTTVLYLSAIATWGLESQVAMFAEECSEAAAEAVRFVHRPARRNKQRLISEVADVLIMAEQMAVALGAGDVRLEYNRKIDRLVDRIAADAADSTPRQSGEAGGN